MKIRRVYSLAKKDLKGIVREPAGLFMILLFPVLITLVFGFAFGAVGGGQPATYQAGVINMSEGSAYPEWGQYFVGNLSETGILRIQMYTSNFTAQTDLAQGKMSAYIIIPANFGVSLNSFLTFPSNSSLWTNTTVYLYLDSGSMFAMQAIPPIVQQALVKTIYGVLPSSNLGPIQIGAPSFIQAKVLTTFDYFAPGIFAFASIFLILTVAESLTFERDKKLLSRINTTPTTSAELMMSKTASNMVLALIQVALVIVMALIIGYHPMGDATSLIFAFIIMAVFSLCCVGFGLIAAALSRTSGAATGISFIFIMPLMFLGTFVSVGLSSIAQTAGRFVPSYYVTDALTTLFLRGAPASSPAVLLDLVAVSIYSVVVLVIGVLLFRKFVRK